MNFLTALVNHSQQPAIQMEGVNHQPGIEAASFHKVQNLSDTTRLNKSSAALTGRKIEGIIPDATQQYSSNNDQTQPEAIDYLSSASLARHDLSILDEFNNSGSEVDYSELDTENSFNAESIEYKNGFTKIDALHPSNSNLTALSTNPLTQTSGNIDYTNTANGYNPLITQSNIDNTTSVTLNAVATRSEKHENQQSSHTSIGSSKVSRSGSAIPNYSTIEHNERNIQQSTPTPTRLSEVATATDVTPNPNTFKTNDPIIQQGNQSPIDSKFGAITSILPSTKVTDGGIPLKEQNIPTNVSQHKALQDKLTPNKENPVAIAVRDYQPTVLQQNKSLGPQSQTRPKSVETPQVRIGRIDVLIDDQARPKPSNRSAFSKQPSVNPFGLRGL